VKQELKGKQELPDNQEKEDSRECPVTEDFRDHQVWNIFITKT
jgi:hypothetical protein